MAGRKTTPEAPLIRAENALLVARSRGRVRKEGASFPVPPTLSEMPADYAAVLARLKKRIAAAQTRAALAVNRELVDLYWHVGATIVQRQKKAGWGEAVVERLAHDLCRAFPDLEGFSPRNIWRMRAFYLAWFGAPEKLTRAVSESGLRQTAKKLPRASPPPSLPI